MFRVCQGNGEVQGPVHSVEQEEQEREQEEGPPVQGVLELVQFLLEQIIVIEGKEGAARLSL